MDAEWFKQESHDQLKTEFVKLQEEYQKLIEKQKVISKLNVVVTS